MYKLEMWQEPNIAGISSINLGDLKEELTNIMFGQYQGLSSQIKVDDLLQ